MSAIQSVHLVEIKSLQAVREKRYETLRLKNFCRRPRLVLFNLTGTQSRTTDSIHILVNTVWNVLYECNEAQYTRDHVVTCLFHDDWCSACDVRMINRCETRFNRHA